MGGKQRAFDGKCDGNGSAITRDVLGGSLRKHYKARVIKFCPLCGSDVVTHVGNNVFVCGTGDVQTEAEGKINKTNVRCNRAFGIVQPVAHLQENGDHRRAIGAIVHEGNNG